MIKFSVALLTYNSEYILPTTLETLKDFKNNNGEIIVLDIGSSDNTINIISGFGSKIEINKKFLLTIDKETSKLINQEFSDGSEDIIKENDIYLNFSEVRNYIASISSNPMVLILDNSNILRKIDLDKIQNLINDYDLLELNDSISIYNKDKFIWKDDKLTEISNEIKKSNIDNNILDIDLLERGNNIIKFAFECFKDLNNITLSKLFALELMNFNFLNSAIKEFSRYLTLTNSDFERSQSLISIGDCLMRQGKEKDAIEYYHKAYLEHSNRYPIYRIGEYFFNKGIWDKCIFYLEGCLSITNYNDDSFIYKDGPYSMLYIAYWWIGDKKKGKYYFDKALAIDPYNSTYLSETKYHYEYHGNDIHGNLTFQETQHLYNLGKKMDSILELGTDGGRSTHALASSCKGILSLVTKLNQNFDRNIAEFGNVKIYNTTTELAFEKFKNQKFDMVYINCENDNDIKIDILNWEKFANKIICGNNFNEHKTAINQTFEISGVIDNIWYKEVSSFEKTIIYKKKKYDN